jgi:diguanylate cyclase (GGDEF)-like protein
MSADGHAGSGPAADDRLRRAERTVARLHGVHAMFSRLRALATRVKDRDALLSAACRIVVDHGGFVLCRVTSFDRTAQRLLPIASVTRSDGAGAAGSHAADAYGEVFADLAWQVIRENRVVVCEDWPAQGAPLDEAGTQVGSLALLPLTAAGEFVAIAVVGTAEPGGFGERDHALLDQLAEEISFGLDYLGKVERLEHLTYYDAVTGLSNRRLFLERATQYLDNARMNGRRVALCLFDIERFKYVNDSLGRPAGDALLKQVGTWLTRRFGNANRVARVGVDHFGVLLPSLTCDGAAADAIEKELDAFVQQPFRLQDSMFRIAAKAGIAVFPDDGADPETLFRHAEAALGEAKSVGDRCLRYRRHMTETVAERLTLETRLRQALEHGEFRLYYQPKVSLQDGRLTGAEALIRWQDPAAGLVPPARFIPVLEETGLINDVGWWALRQAVEDGRRWRKAGLKPVRIAVNVSPLQLRHPGFVPAAWRAIASEPLSPADLELEITESVIMEGIQHSIGVLQAIREMGVRIAIDDFGTGFSSLSYLARLPVDALKIDRSFIVDMTAGPQGLSLVTTIINLAHSLKLNVVAEGVETEEQTRLLRLLGCDELQGHVCSPALPASEFEARFLRDASPPLGRSTAADGASEVDGVARPRS